MDNQLTHDDKIKILKLRTRMSDFGENFRAGRDTTICPICSSHIDCQSFLLRCPGLRHELQTKFGQDLLESIDEVYEEKISVTTIKVLTYAMDLRKTKLKS